MRRKQLIFAIILAASSVSAFAFAARTETAANFLRLTGFVSQSGSVPQTNVSLSATENKSNLPASTSEKTTAGVTTNQTTTNKQTEIPVHVTYLFLFRQLVAFEEKAKEAESKGEDGSRYRTLYKRLANLTDEQFDVLMKTAIDCASEVKLKDEIAKQVAAQLRAQFQLDASAGNAPAPPPPPAELTQLQKQREEIIIRYRELLRAGLGQDFDRFDAFVQSHITSNITTEMRNKATFPPSNTNAFPQSGVNNQNGITQLQASPKQNNTRGGKQ